MFSISGLRGIVDKDLTPDIVHKYAAFFGSFLKPGKIIVGRDARKSGKIFLDAVRKGLGKVGCTVIDLGIVPTPTVLYSVRKLKAKGGIVITASHNPGQWNALKFISPKGQFLSQKEFNTLIAIINKGKITIKKQSIKGRAKLCSGGIVNHISKIISVLKPSKHRLRVGVDAVNGAGSIGLPQVLEKLGCRVYRMNCRFSPDFPRNPEPAAENISELARFVERKKLDLGFACDPDCDRLSIVDENGKAIGEEKSVVLATDFILDRKRGNVVTNLSTTALMDYIVKKYGCRLYRTRVGEAHVVSMMETTDAVIGGEGNGGIIFPKINFTRDALVGAAIVIKLLTERDKSMSEIIDSYPTYYMVKKKMRISRERFERRKGRIMRRIKGKRNFQDGLKIVSKDYWLHIRPSQTEPLIRIIGEAKTRKQIKEYIKDIKTILK